MMEEIGQLIIKEKQGTLTEKEVQMLDVALIEWGLSVKYQRIGVNLFQGYVEENGQRVNIGIYDLEAAAKGGKFSIDELRALPVEMPEEPPKTDGFFAKNLVIATLRGPVQAGGKIVEARRHLAECLIQGGFAEKDLLECMGGVASIAGGKGLQNRLLYYLNSLQPERDKINAFIEKAYSKNWLSDYVQFSQWFQGMNVDAPK